MNRRYVQFRYLYRNPDDHCQGFMLLPFIDNYSTIEGILAYTDLAAVKQISLNSRSTAASFTGDVYSNFRYSLIADLADKMSH